MSLKVPRRSLDRGLPLTSAAGPGSARLQARVAALALSCLTAFTLLEVAGLAHWSLGLKRTGACQADNEVLCRCGGGLLCGCCLAERVLEGAAPHWWACCTWACLCMRLCRTARPAPQGSWSIGIFKGRSPLELQPLERYEPRQDSSAAWPVANPVLTCASVADAPSNFGARAGVGAGPSRPGPAAKRSSWTAHQLAPV